MECIEFDKKVRYCDQLHVDPDKYSEMVIDTDSITGRMKNCFRRNNIASVADLLRLTPETLKKIRNAGVLTVQQAETYLISVVSQTESKE